MAMVAVAGACREEKERAPGKRRKEEGASRGAAGVLQGILLITRKQEVVLGCPGSSTQVLLCPNEEDSVFCT
jgi:hypothetical protein